MVHNFLKVYHDDGVWLLFFVSARTNKRHKSFKALGVLESKWDPIRKKLVRRLLEEHDKVLRSYFAQKGMTQRKGEDRSNCKCRELIHWNIYA